jgi:hypothetical protein
MMNKEEYCENLDEDVVTLRVKIVKISKNTKERNLHIIKKES